MKSFPHSLSNIYTLPTFQASFHIQIDPFQSDINLSFFTTVSLFFLYLQIIMFKKIGQGVFYIMSPAFNLIGQIFHGIDEEIDDDIIGQCYDKYFRKTFADFYHSICDSVEEINRSKGRTQFRIPSTASINRVYKKYRATGKDMTSEEFGKCVSELYGQSGLTGFGAKDTLFYLFGVPATALFLKNRIKPQAISDDKFIPAVTSATVLILSKFNKL